MTLLFEFDLIRFVALPPRVNGGTGSRFPDIMRAIFSSNVSSVAAKRLDGAEEDVDTVVGFEGEDNKSSSSSSSAPTRKSSPKSRCDSDIFYQ